MIKHKKIILGLIVSFIIIVSLVVFGIGTNAYVLQNKKGLIKSNDMMSILLETKAGSGEYSSSNDNSWPTSSYEFNSELSRCVNGGTLTWDSTNNKVMFDGEASDKCYVYFNKIITLSEYIKNMYTGTQGENNLYYHDSTLTNGAGDNSYRFAGSNESVNNFVCFGTDDSVCPYDNLYRIIGVFNNQVKLIKWDFANSNLLGADGDYESSDTAIATSVYRGKLTSIDLYYWNYKNNTSLNSGNGSNTWSTSLLNKTNLNTNFINNIGSTWANKIANTTWKVGGNTSANISEKAALNSYSNEILTPSTETSFSSKIGLVYLSDYAYAADPNVWNTLLRSYSSIRNNNWLTVGYAEWTITPNTDNAYKVFYMVSEGGVNNYNAKYGFGIRPVFNLIDSVKYNGGIGTESDPIRIK